MKGDTPPACDTEGAAEDDLFGPIISSYWRAQALSDGTLVDVSATAAEAGFKFPVAMTRTVWCDCVEWLAADTERSGTPQDQAGRLWDVLSMARLAARRGEGSRINFKVLRVPREARRRRPTEVLLSLVIGPGDDPAPVLTIMARDED